MNTKINAQTILIVLMVCVTVFISTYTYVNAQVGGDTSLFENASTEGEAVTSDPVEGGPGFIMVSPVDFKPYTTTSAWTYTAGYVYNPSSVDSTLAAGLTLPHGATITKLTLYFKDNSISEMTLYLYQIGQAALSYEMAMIRTFENYNFYRHISTTNLNFEIVDNQSYSYLLFIDIPGSAGINLMLTGVRIDYEYTSYSPMIVR